MSFVVAILMSFPSVTNASLAILICCIRSLIHYLDPAGLYNQSSPAKHDSSEISLLGRNKVTFRVCVHGRLLAIAMLCFPCKK